MLQVAMAVCLVCSVLVSVTSVSLRGLQAKNELLDKQRNILAAAGLLPDKVNATQVKQAFSNIEARIVDLKTGRLVGTQSEIASALSNYDVRLVSRDERFSETLDPKTDIAGLNRRERYAQIYLVREQSRLRRMVLPIRGYGLWSTLYGFIALESDLNTVTGLGFYQHGETPGLGGEVDNMRWKSLWKGKRIYANRTDRKNILLSVTRKPASLPEVHHVDGLSGATITTRGVHNMIHYWLGEDGFGPFLKNFSATSFN
jgi:Na+-transporting NADH:ubiquinone oxidoreductase subunit C